MGCRAVLVSSTLWGLVWAVTHGMAKNRYWYRYEFADLPTPLRLKGGPPTQQMAHHREIRKRKTEGTPKLHFYLRETCWQKSTKFSINWYKTLAPISWVTPPAIKWGRHFWYFRVYVLLLLLFVNGPTRTLWTHYTNIHTYVYLFSCTQYCPPICVTCVCIRLHPMFLTNKEVNWNACVVE